MMQQVDTRYLEELSRIPPLTAGEEAALVGRLAAGEDRAARERLAVGCLRLVVGIAGRMARPGLDVGDAIGAGNVGLLMAARRFNARRGRLTTYAVPCIRGAVRGAVRGGMAFASLDAIDVQDDGTAGPDENAAAEDERELARRLVAQLDRREQTVVALLFGIGADDGAVTGAEAGRRLGITRAAVSLIAAAAMTRLRRLAVGQEGRRTRHTTRAVAAARPAGDDTIQLSA